MKWEETTITKIHIEFARHICHDCGNYLPDVVYAAQKTSKKGLISQKMIIVCNSCENKIKLTLKNLNKGNVN